MWSFFYRLCCWLRMPKNLTNFYVVFIFVFYSLPFWRVFIGSRIIGKKRNFIVKECTTPRGDFERPKTTGNRICIEHCHFRHDLVASPFFAFSLVERFLTIEEVNHHCMLRTLQNYVFSCKIFALQILFDTLNLRSLIWDSSKNGTYH